jgi:hypothetical protein
MTEGVFIPARAHATIRVGAALVLWLAGTWAHAAYGGPGPPVVGHFSREAPGERIPGGWKHLTFQRVPTATRYDLVAGDGGTVVRARSASGASALTRDVTVDLEKFPVLVWRWRVDRFIPAENLRLRSGDDCPARIYVIFRQPPGSRSLGDRIKGTARRWLSGGAAPGHALNYIWSAHEPVGTILPNVYSAESRMLVVENGEARRGRWVTYRRNVHADYGAVFGGHPPEVTGVAIMSDSDDTGSETLTYFGDIRFEPRN